MTLNMESTIPLEKRIRVIDNLEFDKNRPVNYAYRSLSQRCKNDNVNCNSGLAFI
jgi:hypothetical protein